MTKKDYVLIAAAIAEGVRDSWEERAHSYRKVEPAYTAACIVANLSEALKSDNPRFDCTRFEDACLPELQEAQK